MQDRKVKDLNSHRGKLKPFVELCGCRICQVRGRYIWLCLVVHSVGYTCKDEIAHLQTWAAGNNLRLNRKKTKEIIFSASRKGALPPPLSGIERVPSLRVLGVTVNDKLTAADHVATLLSSGTSLLAVCDASAALAWYLALVAARYFPRDGCLAHSVRGASVVGHVLGGGPHATRLAVAPQQTLGYCSDDVPVVADLFNTADDEFFHRVKTNSDHVLQPCLPDLINIPYQLRNRSHNQRRNATIRGTRHFLRSGPLPSDLKKCHLK